ncbi:MAG: hypothetical protein HY363_04525 [Candidatus Aenigmarchaeota archaeon]|nr:hypothetical protein [Candidatus Aenigmarchaeota archaeon]
MPQLIIDTANLEEIIAARQTGLLAGVTTNPTLVARQVKLLKAQGQQISLAALYDKIIESAGKQACTSFEVIATDYTGMILEGRKIHKKFPNAWVKVPVCTSVDNQNELFEGLQAIHDLSNEGIKINCTLINMASQGVLAAIAGAYVLSPFTGRVNDLLRETLQQKFMKEDYYPATGQIINGEEVIDKYGCAVSGVDMARQLVQLLRNINSSAKVLAASVRNKHEAHECASIAGVDYITMPAKVFMSAAPDMPQSRLVAKAGGKYHYPMNWEELCSLREKNEILISDWIYHPKTVEGMKGFLNDAKCIEKEYRELFV